MTGWRDDWRDDCLAFDWRRVNDEHREYAVRLGRFGDEFVRDSAGQCISRPLLGQCPTFTEYAAGKATMDDLIKYSAPPRELSHAEWAEGYAVWRLAQWRAGQSRRYHCFSENEI
jgi:hypothetical protein